MRRPRSGDSQVVDRAVDGEVTDVSTREEQRRHHIGVRGESQLNIAGRHRRGVFERLQQWIAEGVEKYRLDQGLGGLATGAVREGDEFLPYPGTGSPRPIDAFEHQLLPAGG